MLSGNKRNYCRNQAALAHSKSSITITEPTTVQAIFQTPHIYHLLPAFKVLPDNSLEKWDRQKYKVSLKYLIKEMLLKKIG